VKRKGAVNQCGDGMGRDKITPMIKSKLKIGRGHICMVREPYTRPKAHKHWRICRFDPYCDPYRTVLLGRLGPGMVTRRDSNVDATNQHGGRGSAHCNGGICRWR
jgi:hypothetical protein